MLCKIKIIRINLLSLIFIFLIQFYQYNKHKSKKLNTLSDLKTLTANWANIIDVPNPKVTMMPDNVSRTRWGDCATIAANVEKCHIRYSKYFLYLSLEHSVETVVHELIHALQWYKIFNSTSSMRERVDLYDSMDPHDSHFWSTLSSFLPNYRDMSQKRSDEFLRVFPHKDRPSSKCVCFMCDDNALL